jgi:hypothetical protein
LCSRVGHDVKGISIRATNREPLLPPTDTAGTHALSLYYTCASARPLMLGASSWRVCARPRDIHSAPTSPCTCSRQPPAHIPSCHPPPLLLFVRQTVVGSWECRQGMGFLGTRATKTAVVQTQQPHWAGQPPSVLSSTWFGARSLSCVYDRQQPSVPGQQPATIYSASSRQPRSSPTPPSQPPSTTLRVSSSAQQHARPAAGHAFRASSGGHRAATGGTSSCVGRFWRPRGDKRACCMCPAAPQANCTTPMLPRGNAAASHTHKARVACTAAWCKAAAGDPLCTVRHTLSGP